MTEDALLKTRNDTSQLPCLSFAEPTKAEALGNSDETTGSSDVGIAHVAPSVGHWWHPCRYQDDLLNTWIRICNPVKSKWRAWQNSKPPALEWHQVNIVLHISRILS